MPIKLKDSLEDKKVYVDKSNTNTIEYLFFIALNILVIPFSAYQTFVGYEKDVAGNSILAIVIAAISAVLFAAMNFGIRQDRLDRKRHLLKVIMYIIPFGLSFFGNFNAFYCNQMQKNLLKDEIVTYKSGLNKTYEEAYQALDNSNGKKEFEANYDDLFNQLKEEQTKIGASGWGEESSKKWKALVSFLQQEGSNIKINDIGKNKTYYMSNAEKFSKKAKEDITNNKEKQIEEPIDDINSKYKPLTRRLDSLMNLSKPIYTPTMLDDIVIAENEIRNKAESFLNRNDIFSNPKLETSEEDEICTIKHTINSAFVEFENPSATIFSFFLSIIIDLAALIYILVFIPYHKKTKKGGRLNSGPQRL